MVQQLPIGTVTFLFTDIQGTTPLLDREPEKMAQALPLHHFRRRAGRYLSREPK